jgi:putative transposase
MDKFHAYLSEGYFYHIYNRGNNREKIFYTKRNYSYFLNKYKQYLSIFIDTYSYCLLPNHFHLLVKVKDKSDIIKDFKRTYRHYNPNLAFNISEILSEQFRKFFISYSMAINEQEKRSGSLFLKNFKRKQVQTNLERLIFYIHYNPVHHNICDNFEKYEWSSYKKILNDTENNVNKEIFSWFGGIENFINYHKESHKEELLKELEYDA